MADKAPVYVKKWRADHPAYAPKAAATWAKIDKLASDADRGVSAAFTAAVAKSQKIAGALRTQILTDLKAGNTRRATNRILKAWKTGSKQFRQDLVDILQPITAQAGALAIEPHLGVDFATMNARAHAWASAHAGTLVTAMTDGQRLAIRAVIEDGFSKGMTRRQMTRRMINEGLGLHAGQSKALSKYQGALSASGLNDETIAKKVARRRARMIRQRGATIARTETMRASNMGVQHALEERIAQGKLDPEKARKVWIVTYDDRLCPHCRAIDGQMRKVHEYFHSATLGSVLTPPLHPRCRCAMADPPPTKVDKKEISTYPGTGLLTGNDMNQINALTEGVGKSHKAALAAQMAFGNQKVKVLGDADFAKLPGKTVYRAHGGPKALDETLEGSWFDKDIEMSGNQFVVKKGAAEAQWADDAVMEAKLAADARIATESDVLVAWGDFQQRISEMLAERRVQPGLQAGAQGHGEGARRPRPVRHDARDRRRLPGRRGVPRGILHRPEPEDDPGAREHVAEEVSRGRHGRPRRTCGSHARRAIHRHTGTGTEAVETRREAPRGR